MNTTADIAWEFLQPLYTKSLNSKLHVTLTYAQSMDGIIAGPKGEQIMISGKDSMIMTHTLRLNMDGIIIGINTLINDSPRLTGRAQYVGEEYLAKHKQPIPVVLDSKLRCPLDASLLKNVAAKEGKNPIIFTGVDRNDEKYAEHWHQLEEAGALIYTVDTDSSGRLNLTEACHQLKSKGMERVMIEGGASVIKTCLSSNDLLDAVVVTIAPTWLNKGITIQNDLSSGPTSPLSNNVRYQQFGPDVVMAGEVLRNGQT
ncbi:dihydrofolate reductase-like domain-containing protein [Umbelopsis sp. PMI_123]|nr:dihydrofolate reductase-like domain-containing protein [Umbelopsis sp. PMI_123]